MFQTPNPDSNPLALFLIVMSPQLVKCSSFSSGKLSATGFHTQIGFQINPFYNLLCRLLLTCFIQGPYETCCRAIKLISTEAHKCSVLTRSQLFGWHCLSAAMSYARHAVTHSAVPLPAEVMSVRVNVCICVCMGGPDLFVKYER